MQGITSMRWGWPFALESNLGHPARERSSDGGSNRSLPVRAFDAAWSMVMSRQHKARGHVTTGKVSGALCNKQQHVSISTTCMFTKLHVQAAF